VGCSVEDLCAAGWHVCAGASEVAQRSPAGCAPAASVPGLFFATRQSGPGDAPCGAGANDIFGCGSLGAVPDTGCAPLDRFGHNLCSSLGPPWSCPGDEWGEANTVAKPDAGGGGVLCCRD
jgi:hypothetical protein